MINPFKKSQVIDNSITRREFKYERNGVTLEFTLRIDVKGQLRDFAELLKVATLEVDKEINK